MRVCCLDLGSDWALGWALGWADCLRLATFSKLTRRAIKLLAVFALLSSAGG